MRIMGLDIGGANTDYVIYDVDENIELIENNKKYLPMWKDNDKLENILHKINDKYDPEVIIVTTTAELADSYLTKKEGIYDITKKVMNVFENKTVKFVSFSGLKDYESVKDDPLSIAAANWIATTTLISKINENIIFMDMGSTTTDIIPIKNAKENCVGHSDLERLCSKELVYTGTLRTNVATITDYIAINNQKANVSSEYFAITADVYRILDKISENEYICSTPDNKAKDKVSCSRRLARVICSDLDYLSDDEIYDIAQYVYNRQINQVYDSLKEVVKRNDIKDIIITSYSNVDVCQKAAEKLDLNIKLLNDYISLEEVNISPTVGCVQMYLDTFTNINLLEKM